MKREDTLFKYATLAPFFILVLGIVAFPALYAVTLSFTDKDLFSRGWQFTGLMNYGRIVQMPDFLLALKNNLIYGVSCVCLQIALGLGGALLLLKTFKGNYIARGIIIFPYLVPTIVAVMSFKWIFNDLYGIINHTLIELEIIKEGIAWFGPSTAMFLVVLVSVWRFFPFATLLFLPALQAIPKELYDAAKVDGATASQRFLHITMPQLKHVFYIVVLLRGIWMFNNFDIIWLMTKGGPMKKTLHIPVLSYTQVFRQYDVALGCSTAVAGLLLLLLPIILYFRSAME